MECSLRADERRELLIAARQSCICGGCGCDVPVGVWQPSGLASPLRGSELLPSSWSDARRERSAMRPLRRRDSCEKLPRMLSSDPRRSDERPPLPPPPGEAAPMPGAFSS